MKANAIALLSLFATALAATAGASTLHGRVKDEQCSVLGRIAVRVRALDGSQARPVQEVQTDDGGNYSLELPSGAYEVCISSSAGKHTCSRIDMPASGDKWMTTQVRDAVPDLSRLGNQANQKDVLK